MIGLVLFLLSRSLKTESVFFYGFAENKETEINHIDDVQVEKIFVNNGQEVKKGDLLIQVSNANIPSKIEGLKIEKKAVKADQSEQILQIQNDIAQLEIDKNSEVSKIQSEIREIEQAQKINASLYEGLKTVSQKASTDIASTDLKLESLRNELSDIVKVTEEKIALHRKVIKNLMNPAAIKNDLLDSELAHYETVNKKLSIYAPSDGLIGTITCKEGENISAFSTLMNFYKHNPTQVKGYVHESHILEVKVGDKLEIASTLHPDRKVEGEVIGLGSRIIEIPERLRKVPDFKTYGREVLIRIPEENRFLQKEKVMVNAAVGENTKPKLSNLFFFYDKNDGSKSQSLIE